MDKISKNGEQIYYQTEIKNWCSHSLGGHQILVNANEQEVVDYGHKRFVEQWDSERKTLQFSYVSKVLKKMKRLNSVDDINGKIEPLICYWYPILNNSMNMLTPFFSVDCNNNFDKVHFFSLSIYLRNLMKKGNATIEITMPNFEQRIKLLKEMYDFGSAQ